MNLGRAVWHPQVRAAASRDGELLSALVLAAAGFAVFDGSAAPGTRLESRELLQARRP